MGHPRMGELQANSMGDLHQTGMQAGWASCLFMLSSPISHRHKVRRTGLSTWGLSTPPLELGQKTPDSLVGGGAEVRHPGA